MRPRGRPTAPFFLGIPSHMPIQLCTLAGFRLGGSQKDIYVHRNEMTECYMGLYGGFMDQLTKSDAKYISA